MDEPTIRQAIRLVTNAKTTIDREQVIDGYDRDSDTLIIYLFGRGIPAVSMLLNDEVMVR